METRRQLFHLEKGKQIKEKWKLVRLKFSRKDGRGLYKKFTDKCKTSLGPEAESLIAQENEEIGETRQSLRKAEKQLQEAEKLSSEREKPAQEVPNLRAKLDETQSLDNEAELRRLQQLRKKS